MLFLSEFKLSKLEGQGFVSDDVEPALNKRMIGAVAVKAGSPYAVVNSRITMLDENDALCAVAQNGKTYVPLTFLAMVYGEEQAEAITDVITHEGKDVRGNCWRMW